MAKPDLLERALSAEEQLESERKNRELLERRLRALLRGDDPDSAERAGSWVGRAENAEQLLAELMSDLHENPSLRDLLPTGWVQRVEAQLHSLQILQRDAVALAERPGDQWWTNGGEEPGSLRRVVVPRPNVGAAPVRGIGGGAVTLMGGNTLTFTHRYTVT